MPFPAVEFLQSRAARVLTLVLVAQIVAINVFSRNEYSPQHRPLRQLPAELGDWRLEQEPVVPPEVQDVLRADETLNRIYTRTGDQVASLFVAYFKSQRTGVNPHSPKNCLPGAGWFPVSSDTISVRLPDRPRPLEANQYVVAKGNRKNVVLYWYQSRDRTIASEYAAKFYLIYDAVRSNRTDTALVRVVVPVEHDDVDRARQSATGFVQDFFNPLRSLLPS